MDSGNKGKYSKRSLESDDFEEDYSPLALERKLTKINQTKRNLLALNENAETDSNSTDYGLNHAETMAQGPVDIENLLDDDSGEETELSLKEIHEEGSELNAA